MAAQIMSIKMQLEAILKDNSKPWSSVLQTIESKTGINRLYVFIASMVVLGLWLVFGFAAQLICNTIGFLYPAYVSIHAVESPNKADDTKWLTYWIVFAVCSVWEYFADFIVSMFPFYWLIKCLFLMWLMVPTERNGSVVLYEKVIRPYFLKHHEAIDNAVKKVRVELPKPETETEE